MEVKSESEVAQSCPTLSDPMDCSLPGSSLHGIFQAGVLEWGAIAFSGLYLSFSHSRAFLGIIILGGWLFLGINVSFSILGSKSAALVCQVGRKQGCVASGFHFLNSNFIDLFFNFSFIDI